MHTSTKIGAVVLVFAAIAFASLRCPYLNGKTGEKLNKSVTNISFSNCDSITKRYFTVSNVYITGTFETGTNVNFRMTGTIQTGYTHTSTDTTIKLGFIQVFSGTTPVNPPQAYVAGPLDSTSITTLTQDAPSGSYTMTLRFNAGSLGKIQCVEIKYKLG